MLQVSVDFCLERFEPENKKLGKVGLEILIAFGDIIVFHGCDWFFGKQGIQGEQVCEPRVIFAVTDVRARIRGRGFDFFADGLRIIHERNEVFRACGRLGHFFCRVIEAHDARSFGTDLRLWDHKRLAEFAVESDGQIARQLDVLFLVLADRNDIRIIQQDVSSHQNRIGEQSDRDIFAFSFGLIFELRHPFSLAKVRLARQDPSQFRVLRDL